MNSGWRADRVQLLPCKKISLPMMAADAAGWREQGDRQSGWLHQNRARHRLQNPAHRTAFTTRNTCPLRVRRVRPTGPSKAAAATSVLPIGAISPDGTRFQGLRSSRRRLIAWVFGLLGAVVLILAGAVLLLVTVDLRPWIEEYGSSSFDRPMTIGTLRIGWGDPLSLEMMDFRLANAGWGSSPDMVRIESVSAEIDPWSLFGGAIRFEKLEVVKPVVVLERDADGMGNWKIGKTDSSSDRSANRSQFPTLIDLALRGGNVSYRTTSGNWLRVALDDLKIRSSGADRPVTIALDGAYNDLQAKLTAEGQSFDAMRDTSRPYGIDFSIANASTSIEFKGTLQDPLDFDGVLGSLAIDATETRWLAADLRCGERHRSAGPIRRRSATEGRSLAVIGSPGKTGRQRIQRRAETG